MKMDLTCLCGAVRITVAKPPEYIHACNCTLCAKSGAWWGYFDPADLTVTGETHGWSRSDKAEAGGEVRFCPACGATTHFVLTPAMIAKHGNTVAGANMRLADPAALAGIELRFPDGRAWSGEGPFGYARPGELL